MRFDNWTEDDASEPMARAPEDGVHSATIVSAREAKKKYLERKPDNPSGLCLEVKMDVAGWAVEHAIPAGLKWKIEELCKAAGVECPVPGEEWDEAQLENRTVRIVTAAAVSAKGNSYVRVEKYLEPEKAAAPTPAKRSKSAPPAPVNDDIPF